MDQVFSELKYSRWYYGIICRARSEGRRKGYGTYFEDHHILPKSMGGHDKKDNRVLLTAREHFICHMLLVRMCIEIEHKIKMMLAMRNFRKFARCSWQFDMIRRNVGEATRLRLKGKPGRPLSEATKEKIRDHNLGKKQSAETVQRRLSKIDWDDRNAKISLSMKGKPKSDETKARMREAAKLRPKSHYINSPDKKAAIAERMTEIWRLRREGKMPVPSGKTL